MRDLNHLLKRLADGCVDFVIVGGFAAAAHGSTMVTIDVDICCRFSVTNLMKLGKALKDLHPVHRMTPARLPLEITPAFCRRLKNLYLDTDIGQLDCLGSILGIGDFAAVRKRSVKVTFPFGICRVLSLDALIDAKTAMGRPRDREAVLQLTALRDASLQR